MVSSDSEDFESADEGHSNMERKDRKKRQSSSNYSESSDHGNIKPSLKEEPAVVIKETTDGWDDFDIGDEQETGTQPNTTSKTDVKTKTEVKTKTVKFDATNIDARTKMDDKASETKSKNESIKTKRQDTGWDDFDDWGDNGGGASEEKPQKVSSPDIKSVADRLASATIKEQPKSSGWGWGNWGVDSIISTATAGINTATAGLSTIGNHVTQGISTVLETGIGIPDPEEMARKNKSKVNETQAEGDVNRPNTEEVSGDGDASFQLGSLISGVTKFVETTSSKVITGGLDTLETIGKKTMEVLQDGDPGLAKKRAMFGLDGDKVVLSQVLKEAKAKADEEDRLREEKREAKEVHYETLFDDFEGLVHLEALEMLSKQVSMRIEDRLRNVDAEKRQEIKETLQQVAELCEMPDDDDDEDSSPADEDTFHERLQEATQDLGLKLQFQPLIKQYSETLSWLSSTSSETEKAIYKKCVASLAHHTALSVELYHKAAEMLLVKTRRSTADEADALTQMTSVLTKHISELATRFTEKLNSIQTENKEQLNNYITNVFLEAGNSSSYIQNAFQLALPILQIGAV